MDRHGVAFFRGRAVAGGQFLDLQFRFCHAEVLLLRNRASNKPFLVSREGCKGGEEIKKRRAAGPHAFELIVASPCKRRPQRSQTAATIYTL
jgi:hypothetical protein